MGADGRYVLAVDSGGTKCDALLARDDGTVLDWCHVDWSDPVSGRSPVGSGRSASTVSYAIRCALGDLSCCELHVIGISHMLDLVMDQCKDRVGFFKSYHMHECDPVFALCEQQFGIAAVAGTGATIQAKTPDGRHLHLDGLGPHLGDYGGAFYIGTQALRAVGKYNWSPRHNTSLVEPIFSALGLLKPGKPANPHDLLVYMLHPPTDRAVIASLARIVDVQARAGDVIARNILHDAATAMAETILCVIEKGNFWREPYALMAIGSVATKSQIFWEHLGARVRAYAPNIVPMLPPFPPVVGAALIALQRINAVDSKSLRQTLFTTAAAKEPQRPSGD